MFMDIAKGEDVIPPQFYLSTLTTAPVRVNITLPLLDSNFRRHITIPAMSAVDTTVPHSVRMNGTGKGRKAIRITAGEDISVIGVNKAFDNVGSFLGIPVDSLGTEYYVVTYFSTNHQASLAQIEVAATQNGTTVTFALPRTEAESSQTLIEFNGKKYKNGQVFSVKLEQYQTMSLESSHDLTGTRIYATKPISAFSGHKPANIEGSNTKDSALTQLPPVHTWGRHFVLAPFPGRADGYSVIIIAGDDDTRITLNNILNSFTISKAGGKVQFTQMNTHLAVSSMIPLLVVQVTHGKSGENPESTAMFIVPAVEQYDMEYISQTPVSSKGLYSSHLTLMAPRNSINGFQLAGDGLNTPVGGQDWVDILGLDPPMMAKSIQLVPGTYRIYHEPSNTLFGAVLHGYLDGEAHAATLGLSLDAINAKVIIICFYIYKLKSIFI